MAIQWTGLFANTGYSSANNKTQDDAVTGMQDTLYVTGPGYGAYEAVVKLHSSTGAVVATVNVSGGGGAFSAPPPVRFVDNSTVYSYSLEVVRGFIPTEDADGIVIRLVGGASKRYPSLAVSTPSGGMIAPSAWRHDGLLVIGDSTTALNSIYQTNAGNGALYNFQTNGGAAWAQVLLGDYRFGAVHYRGRSGIRAQNIANDTAIAWYIDKILASSDALNVQVQLGINDMRNTASRTSEQIRDDIFAIVDKCLAQGRRVAVCSVMPPRSDDADINAAFQQKQMRVNLYIQAGCATRGCGYIALSEAVTDWTNLTVYSRSISPAVATDTLHQNNLGAYIMGKCMAAYWLPLRTKLATYPQHYTNNASLDDTALQILPNPLFNTDANWFKNASAYGTAGDAPVYNIITAPDGIGNAWQIDVPNVPGANASNTFLINAVWDNAPTKYIAGNSIKLRLKYKLEGVGGVGNPVNVYHPWAYASVNSSGTIGASACLYGMPTNPGYITEGHSGVLEAPPCRFTGLETGTAQDVWIGVRCGAAASFRLTVWEVGVYLNDDQYREFPYTWTDADAPVVPPVYG